MTLQVEFQTERDYEGTIPELNRVSLQLSRLVSFEGVGLPICSSSALYSAGYEGPEPPCAGSQIGYGSVSSEITAPGEAPAFVTGASAPITRSTKASPASSPGSKPANRCLSSM